MKRLVMPLLLLAGLLQPLAQAQSDVVVTVELNDQQLQFTQHPRLLDVLQYSQFNADTYWPAAALYQLDPSLEQRRQVFLAQLAELRQHYLDRSKRHQANAVQLLWLQVNDWQVARRIVIPLDIELSRISWQFNPRFDDGSYLLKLGARPVHVHLTGLYQETAPELHRRASDARSYVLPGYRLSLGERSWVFLTHPDGTTEQVGIAYWNKSNRSLAPGTQILIPFAANALPRKYRHLADELLVLAANRVLPE